jgi:TIR domain
MPNEFGGEWRGIGGQDLADVFISYKSERRAAAQHLSRILELNGYSVWFDYGLLSGADFGRQIEREMRAAKAAVVLWCSLSRDSPWVIEEAHLAEKLGTFTPAWLERVDPPLGFGRADTIDLSEWDGAPRSPRLDRLLNEIARRVGRDPVPQFRGLQEYEQTWRSFGAPPLTRFALTAPVADCETSRLPVSAPNPPPLPPPEPMPPPERRHTPPFRALAPLAAALGVPARAPPLPLWRDAIRYAVVPLVVLLAAHYAIVNAFNLYVVYLRIVCVLVPFAAGFGLFWIGARGTAVATAFAFALGLAGVLGMSISEGMYSGDPIMPQSRFEWLDNFQFAATIVLSLIVGHLSAQLLRSLMQRRLEKL